MEVTLLKLPPRVAMSLFLKLLHMIHFFFKGGLIETECEIHLNNLNNHL